MKKIEVTDEMYDFLMDISKEMNAQDHRGTRMPYFFQIQTREQVAAPEGNGESGWHYDGHLIITDEEIKEAIFEWKEWDLEDKERQKVYEELDRYDIKELLEICGYTEVWFEYRTNLENAFLTSRGCNDHIKKNHYHYKEPINYLSYASRNPELEKVFQFLCELSGGKLHT